MPERAWDKFLTDQDKAYLSSSPERPRKIWGQTPAILNIDNYRGVFGDRPTPVLEQITSVPGAMGIDAWEALDKVAELLAVAREAGMYVTHVTGLAEEDSYVPAWSGGRGKDVSEMTPDALERHRRRYEFMPQAQPVEGEVVLRKTAPSAFFGTPLMAALQGLGVDTLIITGESTSGCVRASVVDARSYRFNVVVAEECVYDRHEACHAVNLFDMHSKYATVLPLEEVLEWIAAWRKGPKYDS